MSDGNQLADDVLGHPDLSIRFLSPMLLKILFLLPFLLFLALSHLFSFPTCQCRRHLLCFRYVRETQQCVTNALQKDILRWIRFSKCNTCTHGEVSFQNNLRLLLERECHLFENNTFVHDKYPFTTSLLYCVKNRKPKTDSRRSYKLYGIY